ncbi:MAG: aminotransferase class I/II-fold pyridoxal phosphate-dependent enzyme [Candidatus Caenarcaniphilales bacterium]|nr:aminotransferase class I/II-fold pyridoxal phosphate-dependent enzyme [Candidatus Caenarcaniphilales bacterium]
MSNTSETLVQNPELFHQEGARGSTDPVMGVNARFNKLDLPTFNPYNYDPNLKYKYNASAGMLVVPGETSDKVFVPKAVLEASAKLEQDPQNYAYIGPVMDKEHQRGVLDFFFTKPVREIIEADYTYSFVFTAGGTQAVSNMFGITTKLPESLTTSGQKQRTIGLGNPYWGGYDSILEAIANNGNKPPMATYELNDSEGNFNLKSLREFLQNNKHCTIVLTSPNNPSGYVIPPSILENEIPQALKEHAERGGTVAVGFDLAYIHFIPAHPNYGEFLPKFLKALGSTLGNNIYPYLLMSNSKSLGLYAKRVGYLGLILPKDKNGEQKWERASADFVDRCVGWQRGTAGNANMSLKLSRVLLTNPETQAELKASIQKSLKEEIQPRIKTAVGAFRKQAQINNLGFENTKAGTYKISDKNGKVIATLREPGTPYFMPIEFANSQQAEKVAQHAEKDSNLFIVAASNLVRVPTCIGTSQVVYEHWGAAIFKAISSVFG